MIRARIMLSLMSVLCLLLLASCGGISEVDAIKLAKQAATRISDPPTLYDNKSSLVNMWPDQPGSTLTQGGGGRAFSFSVGVTLTTQVRNEGNGWDVTFLEEWAFPDVTGRLPQHSWLFHVSGAGRAEFIKEEGDKLPQMPS